MIGSNFKTLGSKKSRNGDARGLPEALTAEQLESYKKGKCHSGSDSEYSYISVVSAGGTKHVQRRRKRGDGTYSATESYHSSQDEDGDVRRKQRRHNRLRENSAQSIFSERGTRHVKRRGSRKHSASEDCYSKDEDVVSNTAKMNFLATDKGYSFSSNAKGNVTSEDGDSEYSFYSERSEGGTRYEFKRKVLRDPRGIKIGYGASKPADTDTASLRPRIGSFTGESVDGDEFSRRRLKTITHQSSMVEQFLLDVTTVEQDEPEEPSWPGSTETTFSGSEADMSNTITEERGKYAKEEDPTKKGKSKVDNSDERRQKREQEKLERLERQRLKEEEERRRRETLLAGRRKSMMSERAGTPREKPRSMVTYERGMGREATNPSLKTDAREIGLSHDDWRSSGRRKSYIGKHTLDKPEDPRRVSSRREIRDIPSFNKLPAININKTSSEERRVSVNKGTQKTQDFSDGENQPEHLPERKEDNNGEIFEYGDDGNVRLKQGMKSIDIGSLTADDLRKMGIDPNLSPAEIARKLKEKFGNQLSITSNGRQLGTKRMGDYEKFKSITELANDPDFDVSSVRGPKRMNILFTRGGQLLLEHMKRVLVESKLRRLDFKSNLDEQNSCVDFLNHYRLVDPGKLEGYAKAFVVEDGNVDAVINYKELRIALEGIVCIENMSEKQIEYVLKELFCKMYKEQIETAPVVIKSIGSVPRQGKLLSPEDLLYRLYVLSSVVNNASVYVISLQHPQPSNYSEWTNYMNTKNKTVAEVLHIDDSSQLTFRMFALITALCERVTAMEPFARHLLDICNLADIERKLELYNAMFYHNVQSDRDPNYITSESLKIELIAGGLNWSQQQFIMRQMEPNSWGDISFLDYICYIPLFMSMHDNICDNPLDMSDRKYTLPPRKRPPSVQRDMNPLGNPLRQNSAFLLRKQALDLKSGKLDTAVLKAEKVELLNRYAKKTWGRK